MSVPQRILSSTVAFAVSWALIAFVCVAVGMDDGNAAAYAAASAAGGVLLGEWWQRHG